MTKPFRILHISDIHRGVFPPWKEILWQKAMIGACNHALTRKKKQNFQLLSELAARLPEIKPDFIVFTGDLSSVGFPEEFTQGMALLKPFLEYAGEHFLFIPGNHDRYTGKALWHRKLAETFYAMNGKRWQIDALPLRYLTEEAEFILVDAAKPRPWYLSNGYLSTQEWEHLEELLRISPEPDRPRIVLCHFPLTDRRQQPLDFRRQLNQWQRLEKLGSQGAFQLFLCGHIHHAFVNQHPDFTECCAGSMTIHRQFTIIDFNPDHHSFQCTINQPKKGPDK